MRISRIKVTELFGRHTYDIPIIGNRAVLVAPNGSGKSNILQLLTFMLARQWERMLEISFTSFSVEIDGKVFAVDRENIAQSLFNVAAINENIAGITKYNALELLYLLGSRGLLREILSSGGSRRSAISINVGRSELSETVSEALGVDASVSEYFSDVIRREYTRQKRHEHGVIKNQNEFENILEQYRVVYLPTYRRIEKDIRFIFSDINKNIVRADRSAPDFFLELVDFGMNDVNTIIQRVQQDLRVSALSAIYGLSSNYLFDVVRERATDFHENTILALDDKSLSAILERLKSQFSQTFLADGVRKAVERLRSGNDVKDNDRYIAHYVQLLLDADKNITDNERPTRQFIDICNNYLLNKRFSYDTIKNILTLQSFENLDGEPLPLSVLSSGEKQIVSLFCHLCFGQKQTLMLVDEPELSLSIDWQQRLFSDIWATGQCKLLFATTHSPFIYDNEFNDCAIDLLGTRAVSARQ